ncbi:hypothetical protein EYF80_065046 [Liparis tanakae]|uniref:Uncharacterized protein n=1 Tax=Liparis tanakae TaxID=230148 RepID=A0A4Z2E7N6_9TELE|nr:hypothetical protein EYF80_065046 [Liparis tanakae]
MVEGMGVIPLVEPVAVTLGRLRLRLRLQSAGVTELLLGSSKWDSRTAACEHEYGLMSQPSDLRVCT